MSRQLSVVGFDADDTLWQNEQFFRVTEERFAAMLADYADSGDVRRRLMEAERRNLAFYGFGIKGFVLSMIETAVEVTEGRISGPAIGEILAVGREMLRHPIETLPGVTDTLAELGGRFRLVVVTKGDLLDQERKLAQSGLDRYFHGVEIVSDKTAETYRRVFSRHGEGPGAAMMVGNSLRSDIIPAIEAGSWGVFVPHELTWIHEHAEEPSSAPRFRRIDSIGQLVPLIDAIVG